MVFSQYVFKNYIHAFMEVGVWNLTGGQIKPKRIEENEKFYF